MIRFWDFMAQRAPAAAELGRSAAEGFTVRLRCRCGEIMNDVASPGHVVHHLLTEHGVEQLWGAVDRDVSETVGHRECWLCSESGRLYVGLDGPHSAVRVYAPEAVGIDPADTWADMYTLPDERIWLGPPPAEPGAAPDPAGT